VNGAAGGMTINLGTAGNVTVGGSAVAGSGDTIVGTGSGSFVYNPGDTSPLSVSGGDFINLSGSTGNATINAFGNGATLPSAQVDYTKVSDTIMSGNGSDSVWGGAGDRIGVGSVAGAAGAHLWDHSTTVAGASVLFGTFDATTSSKATAQVTVTNFQSATDGIFYQNESSATTASIVSAQQATVVGGQASTVITLPDGTTMTLVGVGSVNAAMFKP
jgi:hypothetical protein